MRKFTQIINGYTCLKVDGNEKLRGVGKNTINEVLSAIAAMGGYFKFERAASL
jgi:hypothetical protein